MSPQLISLGITLLAVLIILLQVAWGAIRGLKKSTFRLVWTSVFGVLCLFLSGVIAKVLVNFDFSFLHLKFNGIEVHTLPQFVQQTLEATNPDIASMIADNPSIMELCTVIATSGLSVIVFEVLFWLTKWIFWPIWAIFSHVFFGGKKHKIDADGKKIKKHGGFGALIGIAVGFVVAVFTFVPLATLNSAIMQVEAETMTMQGDGTEKGAISLMLGDNAKYLTVYEDSILNNVFKYTGMGALQSGMSNVLTSTSFKGQKITLTKEISNYAPVYKDYLLVRQYDFNNLTNNDVKEIIKLADDAQTRVLSGGIVKSVYNEVAPYLAKNILTRADYFIKLPDLGGEFQNNLMRDVIKAFFGINELGEIDINKLVKIEDIKDDISKMLEIANVLNDNSNLVVEVANRNISLQVIQDNIDETKINASVANSIVDKFFEMKTIDTLLPVVVEPSIEFAVSLAPAYTYNSEEVKIEFTPISGGISKDGLKLFLKDFATSGLKIVDGIDLDTLTKVSADNFKDAGKILDSFKANNILSTQTYNSVLNYGTKFAKKYVNEQELQANIKSFAEDAIDTVYDIGSFETEFGYIGNTYKIYAGEGELDAEKVCKMLDAFKPSILYTQNIDSLISNGTAYVTDYITENNLPLYTTDLDVVLNSIKQVSSFEQELSKIDSLYSFVNTLISSGDISTEIIKQENLILLGQKLDLCIEQESALITDANCKILLKNFIGKMQLPEDFEDYHNSIVANINKIESYQTELTAVAKLLGIKDVTGTDREKLGKIGKIIDEVKSCKLLDGLVVQVVSDYIDKQIPSGLSQSLLDAINAVKGNLSVGLTFENEFVYAYDLINIDTSSIAGLRADLANKLINDDEAGTSKSNLITREIIYDIVIDKADEISITGIDIKQDIVNQLTYDKNNNVSILDVLDQLDTLEAEIEALKVVPEVAELNRAKLVEIGSKIDALSTNYNLILDDTAVTKIGDYVAQQLNLKVQQNTSLPAEQKQAVQNVYTDFVNGGVYSTFISLFTAFADALELA